MIDAILVLTGFVFVFVVSTLIWLTFGCKLHGYCRWCGVAMYSRRAQSFHDAAKCCAATDSMNSEVED